jgi:hypothetical protein
MQFILLEIMNVTYELTFEYMAHKFFVNTIPK